jgi:hypothetical protein
MTSNALSSLELSARARFLKGLKGLFSAVTGCQRELWAVCVGGVWEM